MVSKERSEQSNMHVPHNIPFLGLCLGMQLTIVEFARNVIGYKDAHSHGT